MIISILIALLIVGLVIVGTVIYSLRHPVVEISESTLEAEAAVRSRSNSLDTFGGPTDIIDTPSIPVKKPKRPKKRVA